MPIMVAVHEKRHWELDGQLPGLCLSQKTSWQDPKLLQPSTSPTAPWREISMDFIVELPENWENTVIWVITDLFSRQAHFLACPKIPSIWTLVQRVYRLHGVLECIILDLLTRVPEIIRHFPGLKFGPLPPDKWEAVNMLMSCWSNTSAVMWTTSKTTGLNSYHSLRLPTIIQYTVVLDSHPSECLLAWTLSLCQNSFNTPLNWHC